MSNFNFTFQPGMSSEQILGFEMAGRIWSQYIDDDAVFNIDVAITDALPSSVVGGALPVYVSTNMATVQAALNQDATSSDDGVAIANLNTIPTSSGETQYRAILNGNQYQSSNLTITQANAKALGLQSLVPSNSTDGYVLFNGLNDSNYSWDYDFSRTSATSDQQLDFLGMALHELGHVMGFVSGIDSIDNTKTQTNQQPAPQFSLLGLGSRLLGFGNRRNTITQNTTNQVNLSQTSVFDLFRYSTQSANVKAQELTQGKAAYFSIDGGKTSIAPLSTGFVESSNGVAGYQASHWGSATPTKPDLRLGFPSLFDIVTNPFRSVFNLAGAVLSLPGALLGGQFSTVAQNSSQLAKSLGIMDPALVPGTRSSISALDLQALDVIGYDLSKATVLPLDYGTLLQNSQTTLSQTTSGSTGAAEDRGTNTGSTVSNQQASTDDELLERRLSQVSTRRAVFFQEVDTSASTLSSIELKPAAQLPDISLNSGNSGTLLNAGTTSASKILSTAVDENQLGKEIENDELLSSGSTLQSSEQRLQTSDNQTLSNTTQWERDSLAGTDDSVYVKDRPFQTSWQVLFGVSDNYLSGRNGTGAWMFNQSSNPLLLNLEAASSLTRSSLISWR
ncbi:MAG: hypothetical protein HLUCCA11_18130 [Phormidesmis priestleyi Ana]|uniref:Uncharacterized protein n=1 Tax=Phormidesmis priestleyi Ana TaxID=1666911 RepID=A0A0P7ZG15_9CYAN|nr:MAG: hypothetical protein HLUCCA11_18130 [Phormidesmis priestleyi Ana]